MKKTMFSAVLILSIFSLIIFVTQSSARSTCTMDVQCGAGKKCVDGVCTGGSDAKIKGKCVTGKFGKKVCDNTGDECSNDSQCWK